MIEETTKNLLLIGLAFIILSVTIPSISAEEIKKFSLNQDFVIQEDGSINVSFRIVPLVKDLSSIQFYFPKHWNITNLFAYEQNTNSTLLTDRTSIGEIENVVVYFLKPSDPSDYSEYVLNFEMFQYAKQSGNDRLYFVWNWGNASFDLPLQYTIISPQFNIIKKSFDEFDEHKIADNRTIVVFKGEAKAGEYFLRGVYLEKMDPQVEVIKSSNKKELLQGEKISIDISITNKGNAPVKNILLEDNLPSSFKLVNGNNSWSGNLGVGESAESQSIVEALTAKTQKFPSSKVVYYDVFGRMFEERSNELTLKVNPEKIYFMGMVISREVSFYLLIGGFLSILAFIFFNKENRTFILRISKQCIDLFWQSKYRIYYILLLVTLFLLFILAIDNSLTTFIMMTVLILELISLPPLLIAGIYKNLLKWHYAEKKIDITDEKLKERRNKVFLTVLVAEIAFVGIMLILTMK